MGAVEGVAAKRAAVEDERAGAERAVVADLDGLAEVEGRETAVIIGGIEDDRAAAALQRGGVGLKGRADRAEDDVVRASEDVGAVEVERGAAAAEAVDGAGRKRREAGGSKGRDRRRNERAGEVGRGVGGDARAAVDRPKRAEEGATVAEGVLVDGQVIADHAEADDAGEGAGSGAIYRGEGRHGADVAEGEGRQTGEVIDEGEAAADVAGAELDAGAGVDGDRAGTEGRRRRGGDQADEVTLMDRDRSRHRAGAREEREGTRTELVQRTRATDGADEEGGVEAGGLGECVDPGVLGQRGRTGEDEALGNRQLRRVGNRILAGREGQRAEARRAAGRTVIEGRVTENRDVGQEVDIVGVNSGARGIDTTTGQTQGDGINLIRRGGVGARTDVGRGGEGEFALVDRNGAREQRNSPRTGVGSVNRDIARTSLGQTDGVDRAGGGKIVINVGRRGVKDGLALGADGAEDPVITVSTVGGGGKDDADGFARRGGSADGEGIGAGDVKVADTEGESRGGSRQRASRGDVDLGRRRPCSDAGDVAGRDIVGDRHQTIDAGRDERRGGGDGMIDDPRGDHAVGRGDIVDDEFLATAERSGSGQDSQRAGVLSN